MGILWGWGDVELGDVARFANKNPQGGRFGSQELEAQFVQIDGLRHKDCSFGFF